MSAYVARYVWSLLLAIAFGVSIAPAAAHEARPAYLGLRQVDAQTYEVLWKTPGLSEDKRLALDVEFAPDVARVGTPSVAYINKAFAQRWQIRRANGLDGTRIRIVGLESTLTDALVRLERLDGTTQTVRLLPSSPSFVVEATPGSWEVARTYLGLGIEHILLGVDHLLFVLALIILIKGPRKLLWAITAFTVAHSLTLASATLGWLHVPISPVEACIALSIVFLASEIVHARSGHASLAYRSPWIVAFAFGLLHGLGFASALSEVGLPSHAIPVALLFFNLGVEAGQLMFIAVAQIVILTGKRLPLYRREAPWQWKVPVYAIGSLAAYWTIERIGRF